MFRSLLARMRRMLPTLLLIPASAIGADVPFVEDTIDAVFDGATDVRAADVDGDGDLDVIGAAFNADDVSWWENTSGDGSTWLEHQIDTNFNGASSVCTADLDGDDDLDVVGVAFLGDDVSWWENLNGAGTSWAERTVETTFPGPVAVDAGNLDGDADVDIVVAGEDDDSITWWQNLNGSGLAWSETAIDLSATGASSVQLADVDGDLDLDVVGAASIADDVAWYENTAGNASSFTKHLIDGSFDGAAAVFAFDIDGDLDLDIVAAAQNADDIVWYQNLAGNGLSWSKNSIDPNFNGARSVWAADMDLDGDADVLGAGLDADDIAWWENTAGDGSAWTERTIDPTYNGAASVRAYDIDDNGTFDVLGAAELADDITWWQSGLVPAVCGDVDDDGDVDAGDVSTFGAFLADPTGAPLSPAGQSKCTVIDPPSTCDVVDLTVIRRVVEGPDFDPGIAPVCAAVLP